MSVLFLQLSTASAWKQQTARPQTMQLFFKATIDFTKHKFWTASSKPEWSGHQKHSRSKDIPKKTKYSVYEVIHTPDIPSLHGIFQLSPGMTLFKSYLRSWRQNLCLLHLNRRLPYLERPYTSKTSTTSLAKVPDQGNKRDSLSHTKEADTRHWGKDKRRLRGGRR